MRYLPLIWSLDVWDIACSHCCHCHCSLLLIICNIPTVPITTLTQWKWFAKQHIPQNVWLLLSIYNVCKQFSIIVAICQCAGWISVPFHPSCHHVVYVNAFQLCLWFCWHTLDAVYIFMSLSADSSSPSLLTEIVNTPHNRLTCPDDNMCVSKPIYSDLCCVHLQVISVIPPASNPAAEFTLLFAWPPLPSLLGWSSCIQRRISL